MTTQELTNTFMQDFFENHPELYSLLPQSRELRWRYFDVGRSLNQAAKRGYPVFAWSTERNSAGKFLSWVWQPQGDSWVRRKTVTHSTRKAAKARALRLRDTYRNNKV